MDTKVDMRETKVGVEVEDGIQFSGCQCPKKIFTDYETKFLVDDIVDKSGLTRLVSVLNLYPGKGSGFVYLCGLAESHLVVATWPEFSGARIDLSACNLNKNNRPKVEFVIGRLRKLFRPTEERIPETDLVTGRRYWTW